MKCLISRSPIGVFAFSEKGDLLYYELSSSSPTKAVEAITKPLSEDFVAKLKDYDIVEGKNADKLMRKGVREFALSLGFVKNDKEFNEFMSAFGAALSRKRMKGMVGRDRLLIQAGSALDDLNKITNLLLERIDEWYSLHYPELRLIHKEILDRIIKYGRRENHPNFKDSTGIELTDEDENILKDYAASIHHVIEQKKQLETYIKSTAKQVMPNTAMLIDPVLATKLLAAAGSLEKLARMPASSIQLIGAEKALFRHLKKKGKSPKFGLIFMDAHIQNAPEEQRGKVARIISSMLMKAARIDFYSGRVEKQLKDDLEDEIKAIK